MQQPLESDVTANHIIQQLHTWGIAATADLDAFLRLINVQSGIDSGTTIIGIANVGVHLAVLLKGIACLSTQHTDGSRQIHTFYNPADLLGVHDFLSPAPPDVSAVQAVTSCTIGRIERCALEQAMEAHPAIGRAVLRAAMMQASMYRQHLSVSRRPALQRVAHLLCEQLARLEDRGSGIPLAQIDIADAAGLSAVHADRILQDLRKLGALAEMQGIHVADGDRLLELAAFDERYLDPPELRWDLRFI